MAHGGDREERAIKCTYDVDLNQWSETPVTVRIAAQPFQAGAMRNAFHMTEISASGQESRWVLKLSKNPAEPTDVYENDVKMQMLARRFAEFYNERDVPKKVEFLSAFLLKLQRGHRTVIAAVEKHIRGEYVKYNNNWSWSDNKRNTPQAFSHFTHERSKHQLLVCDLQGVGDLWTDPQVHTKDGHGFGKGNMGQKGIQAFLANHQCNAICEHLRLPVVRRKARNLPIGTVPRPRPPSVPPQPAPQSPGGGRDDPTGVGLMVHQKPSGKFEVLSTVPGGGAAHVGILPRDQIMKLDGRDITGITMDEFKHRITGPPGSSVAMEISRRKPAGNIERLALGVTRGVIVQNSPKAGAAADPAHAKPDETLVDVFVTVMQAHDLVIKHDDTQSSNPFVLVYVDGVSQPQHTKTIRRNLNPVWNETLEFYCLANAKRMHVLVLDADDADQEPIFLGQCWIEFSKLRFDTGADTHWWVLKPNAQSTTVNRGHIELSIRVVKAQDEVIMD